jgi:hypothetical protein
MEHVALAMENPDGTISPPFLEFSVKSSVVPILANEVCKLRKFFPVMVIVNGQLVTVVEFRADRTEVRGQPITWEPTKREP